MNVSKRFFFAVLFISTLFHTYGQNPKNSWYKGDFNEKVKSCTQTRYSASDHFGQIIKTGRSNAEYGPFDKKTKYNPNGEVMEITRYINSSKVCTRANYAYSENTIAITKRKCDSSIIGKQIYELNNEGEILKYRRYDSTGILEYIETTTYSLIGDTIFEKGYDPIADRTVMPTKKILKYDQNSNIIDQVIYQYSRLFLRYTYDYNNNNKIKEKQSYVYLDANELISHTVEYYNEGENVVEKIKYQFGEQTCKGIKAKYTYEYNFDHRGNWIKQIKYEKGIPKYIVERSIVYYK